MCGEKCTSDHGISYYCFNKCKRLKIFIEIPSKVCKCFAYLHLPKITVTAGQEYDLYMTQHVLMDLDLGTSVLLHFCAISDMDTTKLMRKFCIRLKRNTMTNIFFLWIYISTLVNTSYKYEVYKKDYSKLASEWM